MKKLIALCTLTVLAACATGPKLIPTDGPVRNQVERIVGRHDVYVNADMSLLVTTQAEYIAEAAWAWALVDSSDKIGVDVLEPALSPVLDRHDSYVRADGALSVLEKETYLASTSGIRSLLVELQ